MMGVRTLMLAPLLLTCAANSQNVALPQRPLSLWISAQSVGTNALAQVRIGVASPVPLASGALEMEFDPSVFGRPRSVDVFSGAGDQTGVAEFSANRLKVRFSSRSGGIGRLPGVPVVVVNIPVSAPAGATAALRLLPSDTLWRDVHGNRYMPSAQPSQFRVGGDLSIDSVTPGGGLLPERTKVRIAGRGFTSATTVHIEGVSLIGTEFISPNAVDVVPAGPVDLTGRRVVVQNPGGREADFYPALRAELTSGPGGLVQMIFPQQLFVSGGDGGFALQNPHLEPVQVSLHSPPLGPPILSAGPWRTATKTLEPGEAFYIFADGPDYPRQFSSRTPIRFGTSGPFYATGPDGRSVFWNTALPACSLPGIAEREACWLAVAGSEPKSAKLRILASPQSDFTATVQTESGRWLTVSPERGQTHSDITLTADPSSLPPGDHRAAVTIAFEHPAYTPVSIPFTFQIVETTVDFKSAPSNFFFVGRRTDPPPPPITVDVTATRDGTPFRIDLESTWDTGWFLISPREGVTPATLNMTFDPSKTGEDFYRAVSVILRGPENSAIRPAVVAILEPQLAIGRSLRVFWARSGGRTPAPQTISARYYNHNATRCSQGTVISARTSSGGNWLGVALAPLSREIEVSVDPRSLRVGIYEGAVSVSAPAYPECPAAEVEVKLAVTDDDPDVTVEPRTILLTAPSGGSSPGSKASLTATSGQYPVGFASAVSTDDGTNWLSVDRGLGLPEGTVTVVADAKDLPPGAYRGSIRITAPPESGKTVIVPVQLEVTAAEPMPPPSGPPLPVSLVSGASQTVRAVAPGELLTIHGVNLAPAQQPLRTGERPGLTVLFDGVEAPVHYASRTQLNVTVPTDVAGKSSVRVRVETAGWRSVVRAAVGASAPALFSADGTGAGLARAFNPATDVANSLSNPAVRGGVIRLLATGLGQTARGTPGGDLRPVLPVSVRIAGVNAPVRRIASAAGMPGGVFEIDVIVPEGIAPGPGVPVVLTAGSASSPDRITIAVR